METREVVADELKVRVVVSFDVYTKEFSLEGCDKNPVVALGLLNYALARVRRFLTTSDIQAGFAEAAKNAPRIRVPV